MMGGTGLY